MTQLMVMTRCIVLSAVAALVSESDDGERIAGSFCRQLAHFDCAGALHCIFSFQQTDILTLLGLGTHSCTFVCVFVSHIVLPTGDPINVLRMHAMRAGSSHPG